MSYDVLVYGPLFCDLIFTDLPGMPQLGTEIFAGDFTIAVGGSAIVAAGLHRLGAKVGLIADLGNDPISRLAGSLLDEIGIDRTLIREHPHPLPQLTVALSFPQDRAFVTRLVRPQHPVDLGAILREHKAGHLHIGSFLAAFDAPDAPAQAHAVGTTVSMDLGWDESALRFPTLWQMIAELDVFLPSRGELCIVAGEDDHERALDRTVAHMRHGVVVMKNGADGAIARSHDTRIDVPAVPVTPVDTTGAGDAFDAGFVYAYQQGLPLGDCLNYGAVCGALTTTVIGGATGTPMREEVEQWLSKLRS